METRKIVFLLTILALVALMAYLVQIPLRDQTQPMHNAVLSLDKKPVGQSFTAKRGQLYRLDVFMAVSSPPKAGELTLLLSESTSSSTIRKAVVPASQIKNNRYLSFAFEPIRNAKDRQFFFRLTPGNFDAKNMYVWFYSSQEVYPPGKGFLGMGELDGDLQFSSFSRTSVLEAGKTVFSAVADKKPFPLNLAIIYAFLVGLYLLAVGFLLAKVLSMPHS